jgi:hypothetical protein
MNLNAWAVRLWIKVIQNGVHDNKYSVGIKDGEILEQIPLCLEKVCSMDFIKKDRYEIVT